MLFRSSSARTTEPRLSSRPSRRSARWKFPTAWYAELLLVDNASTDATAHVVANAALANVHVKYLFEPRQGQCFARNTALASARGEIILFTDDDVTPARDWVAQMIAPILDGRCDAVMGHVTLAPEIMRPWLTSAHRWWLASSDDAKPREDVCELVGASMGFRRSVLDRVPEFDTELGPGALGFGDDSLFGWQLAAAGFRIAPAPAARAIHHLDTRRLARSEWLRAARQRGRGSAYLRYHWEHADIRLPWIRQRVPPSQADDQAVVPAPAPA